MSRYTQSTVHSIFMYIGLDGFDSPQCVVPSSQTPSPDETHGRDTRMNIYSPTNY